MPVEKSFPLERVEVLHDRSLTGETEMRLDFPRARRDPFFPLLGLDELQDVSLPIGEHEIMLHEKWIIASSNEQILGLLERARVIPATSGIPWRWTKD